MKNYVEIVRNGIFYQVFNDDSIIINYLFNYKIVNNRCGFPLKNIDYVISELKKNHINFRCDDTIAKYKDNKYHQILSRSKNKQDIEKRINRVIECIYLDNNLLDEIEVLCKIN